MFYFSANESVMMGASRPKLKINGQEDKANKWALVYIRLINYVGQLKQTYCKTLKEND